MVVLGTPLPPVTSALSRNLPSQFQIETEEGWDLADLALLKVPPWPWAGHSICGLSVLGYKNRKTGR